MTEETFLQLCETFAANRWLLGLLIATGTCFLEDAARGGVALLVVSGQITWQIALSGMIVGAMAGDLGLYLIGRYATDFLVKRGWLNPERLDWIDSYFNNHAIKTIILSRFLAGSRTIAFCGAGVTRYPLPRFILLLFISGGTQALLFLWLGRLLGERLMPYLQEPKVLAGSVLAGVIIGALIYWYLAKRRNTRLLKPNA